MRTNHATAAMKTLLVPLVLNLHSVHSFYLPGVNPYSFSEGET